MTSQTGIELATERFINEIKNTSVYQRYIHEKEKLDAYPELKRRIDDYRREIFAFNTREDEDRLFDEVDRLEEEGANFRANPLVSDFLAAELAFCRMMQEVYTRITAEVNFDIELTGGN